VGGGRQKESHLRPLIDHHRVMGIQEQFFLNILIIHVNISGVCFSILIYFQKFKGDPDA
jgi:hypothetical protein